MATKTSSRDPAAASSPEDAPTNVSAAGQADIQVSLARDSSHENGVWLWASET